MKLKVIIYEAEEGGFWAEVPALPGCFSQGETIEETIANLREAVELYLEHFPMTFHGAALVTTFDVAAHA